MAIIRGTTGDDTILPESEGGNSEGVIVINPPPGDPFSGDVDNIGSLAGNDFVDGGLGDDTAVLADGDDTFRWDPGEGSDDVRGGRGTDILLFNGADVVENFTISDSANPNFEVDLFRDVGNILMELEGVERIDLNALGGDDVVNAADLTVPTALTVNGGTGDDSAILGPADDRFIWNPGDGDDVVDGRDGTDTLVFNGSDDVENFTISDGTNLGVDLFRDVGEIEMDLTNIERIELNGLDGDDNVDASDLTQPTALIVNGGRGNDTATLGPADDEFIWNPGDGDDVVDGRDGTDTLVFNGSAGNEEFVISDLPDGRVELFRNVGEIEMDLTNIERIKLDGMDGDDDVDAAALTQDVQLDITAGGGCDSVFAGPADDIVRGGAGNDIMFGAAGGDTFAFGAETGDGITDSDTIGDYDQAEGDVVDLSQSGGLVSSAPGAEGLSLTLGGGDEDLVFLAGVDSVDDVTFA
jgi:Ca2+-binding RTX toxin-like protein